jgi:hypothetical protein
MAREPAVAEYHPDAGPQPGLLTQVTGGLAIQPGTGDRTRPPDKLRQPVIPWEACHPVGPQFAINLTAGAGIFFQPDLLGPSTGYWWDVRKFSAWGFTAGTVTVFKNVNGGEQVAQQSTAGMTQWSGSELLAPDDALIVVAAGITGTVQCVLRAVEIATPWLSEYLL